MFSIPLSAHFSIFNHLLLKTFAIMQLGGSTSNHGVEKGPKSILWVEQFSILGFLLFEGKKTSQPAKRQDQKHSNFFYLSDLF